jgi:hypothetical protein
LSGVVQVSVLHGNLLPQERDKVMDDFRAGRTKVSNGCTQSVDLRSFLAYGALKVMLLLFERGKPRGEIFGDVSVPFATRQRSTSYTPRDVI